MEHTNGAANVTTTTENRDAIARAMGWTYKTMAGQSWWDHPEQLDSDTHPIPNTADAALDAFARLLGDQWQPWTRESDNGVYWYATLQKGWDGEEYPTVKDTGDFKADLFALIIKALEARKA